MKFPTWTRKRGMSKDERASARLSYLIHRLAIEVSPKGSVKSIADATGYGAPTIITYISRGAFTAELAAVMENVFGKDLIKAEWLTNPLDIVDQAA